MTTIASKERADRLVDAWLKDNGLSRQFGPPTEPERIVTAAHLVDLRERIEKEITSLR